MIINQRFWKFKFSSVLIILIVFMSCKNQVSTPVKKSTFVDPDISETTMKLHNRITDISKNGFAVGHQDATSYGIGWKHADSPDSIKSDVKEITNDFPAVFGFDIGRIELGHDKNLDAVPFETMRKLIIDAHKKGGIITISWHADNPVTGGDSWDKTSAVSSILTEGNQRKKYELWISRVADFMKSLTYNNEIIPVIFRPFHEMNGAWFWWGNPNCTASDYIKLWKQTVELLRDKHDLHNLLYVYSPNKLNPTDEYLTYYPGDEYVDMLGIDIYDFKNAEDYVKSVIHDLKIVKEIADKKNKLFAFTETGIEALPTENWYSEILYPNLKDSGISWVLFWRNFDKSHHYMPFKGHQSENDFKKFYTFPNTYFLNDINNIKTE